MRTQWTTKGNRDAGSSCLCDRGLHRYLRNFGGGGVEPPNHPLGTLLYCRNIIGTIILEAHNYQEMKAGHFRRRVCYSSRVVQQTSTTFFIFIWFRAII